MNDSSYITQGPIPSYRQTPTEDNVAAERTADLQDSDGTQGLIDYIRVIQFVNSNGIHPDHDQQPAASRLFIIKGLLYLHLFLFTLLVALTFWAILNYNIRLYKIPAHPSEVLVVLWLLRAIWHVLNGTLALKYHSMNNPNYRVLRISCTTYNIFTVFWLAMAIYYLGINPHEDLESTSSRICYFLLFLTIVSYIVPMVTYSFICLLLYFTLFLIIYFRHGTLSNATIGVPKNVIKIMKTAKYKDILTSIKSGNKSEFYYPPPKKEESTDVLIAIPSDQADDFAPGSLMDACDNDAMLSERLCAICMLDIEDDDKVLILPCDIRHLFHRGCLLMWFKKSKLCPICRTNICDVVNAAN